MASHESEIAMNYRGAARRAYRDCSCKESETAPAREAEAGAERGRGRCRERQRQVSREAETGVERGRGRCRERQRQMRTSLKGHKDSWEQPPPHIAAVVGRKPLKPAAASTVQFVRSKQSNSLAEVSDLRAASSTSCAQPLPSPATDSRAGVGRPTERHLDAAAQST